MGTVERVAAQDLAKHGLIVAWLKAEHGFSHSHANHVAKAAHCLAQRGL